MLFNMMYSLIKPSLSTYLSTSVNISKASNRANAASDYFKQISNQRKKNPLQGMVQDKQLNGRKVKLFVAFLLSDHRVSSCPYTL